MRFYKYALVLFWSLFCGRVLAQLFQYISPVSWLPPFKAWQSGILPYGFLLLSQCILLIGLFYIVLRHWNQKVKPNWEMGLHLRILGAIYMGIMITRYALRMTLYPTERWFGGTIPIFFHLILSGFVLTLGFYQVQLGAQKIQNVSRNRKWLWSCIYAAIVIGICFWLIYQFYKAKLFNF
jgi:uncharacterized protein